MARKQKPDETIWSWTIVAAIVFGGAAAWMVYVWTHPDYIPPCNPAPRIKGAGGGNCAFSAAWAERQSRHRVETLEIWDAQQRCLEKPPQDDELLPPRHYDLGPNLRPDQRR